jgi:GT2 family glycosyltransferase
VKISVVIPTYNRAEILYRTLYSLCRQKDNNYELLVSVDDDQDKYEESVSVCKSFINEGASVRYFYTGQYKRGDGWSLESYPYNVGIRHAVGEIIILNSGDVISISNTIDQHRQRHKVDSVYVSTVHALIQEVQNKIDDYDWKSNPSSLLFKGSCYKMFTGIGKSYTAAYEYEDAGTPYHFQMSIRKDYLHKIRGFDEDFYGIMPCGDDDLAHRIKKLGLNFVYTPEILAVHQFHKCPELITNKQSRSNKLAESGHSLYKERMSKSIIRNANHEWGQYPRDMINLPDMSGVK